MKTTAMLKLAASTLILGVTTVGCSPSMQGSHVANASDTKMGKVAMKAALAASKALGVKDFAGAVGYAETAVAAMPRDAGYRMLLGQAYLGAGRFSSAETAFSEVLTLMPDDHRAALKLALVQVALGKNNAARTTLNEYRDRIGASDYGLALALAGDVDGGVSALEAAVTAGADAKTRQNLALVYALSGEWNKAHVTAAQDLAPADADARIIQWASFAKPGNETGRVASLLGVQPVDDAGQPTRLALAPVTGDVVKVAEVVPVPTPVTVPVVPTPVAAVFETAAPAPTVNLPLDAPVIYAATTPVKQEIVAAPRRGPVARARPVQSVAVESGQFVVQLGAYQNVAVSRDAWKRVAPRFGLADYQPANSSARVRGASFVRLSVGGFVTRAEATQVCVRIKADGGNCFVRWMLADKPAQWVQRGMAKMRVASS
jgi:Flp pilus assembly protein TadD